MESIKTLIARKESKLVDMTEMYEILNDKCDENIIQSRLLKSERKIYCSTANNIIRTFDKLLNKYPDNDEIENNKEIETKDLRFKINIINQKLKKIRKENKFYYPKLSQTREIILKTCSEITDLYKELGVSL